jgi:hypothetical protein
MQFGKPTVVAKVAIVAAVHRRRPSLIVMKEALCIGEVGGLDLLTGSFRLAARRYNPKKTNEVPA